MRLVMPGLIAMAPGLVRKIVFPHANLPVPRFSLKTLLGSVTLFALAITAAMTIRFQGQSTFGEAVLSAVGWLASGALVGAAIGNLYGKIGEGAGFGFVVQIGLMMLATMIFVRYFVR